MTDEAELKKREREMESSKSNSITRWVSTSMTYPTHCTIANGRSFADEFWDKALPVTFVPEVPKPAGPPYMMYTYQSNAKAVKDQILGKEFLNTIPFFPNC